MVQLTLLDSSGLSLNIQTSISAYEKGERSRKQKVNAKRSVKDKHRLRDRTRTDQGRERANRKEDGRRVERGNL